MKRRRKALAEIIVDKNRGWVLPTFGNRKNLRYWGHAHFEADPTWEKELWTLIVEPEGQPNATADNITATIYFMAEDAPQHLLQEGATFGLSVEDNFLTKGAVKRILQE